jgi:hypothetical protein
LSLTICLRCLQFSLLPRLLLGGLLRLEALKLRLTDRFSRRLLLIPVL